MKFPRQFGGKFHKLDEKKKTIIIKRKIYTGSVFMFF